MKARRILFYIFMVIVIAINVLIIVESAIGGDGSASQSFSFSEAFINWIESFDPSTVLIPDREAFHAVFRKVVGHFLLFGGSGLFTTLTLMMHDKLYDKFKWKIILFSAGFGLTIAFISELIQYFTPDRYGAFTDVLIDFGGYVLFMGLSYLVTFLIFKKHRKNK